MLFGPGENLIGSQTKAAVPCASSARPFPSPLLSETKTISLLVKEEPNGFEDLCWGPALFCDRRAVE